MFAPRVYIRGSVTALVLALKLELPVLKAYHKAHSETVQGKQSQVLAQGCRRAIDTAEYMEEIFRALSLDDDDKLKNDDWIALFKRVAAMIGPPTVRADMPKNEESKEHNDEQIEEPRDGAGPRQDGAALSPQEGCQTS